MPNTDGIKAVSKRNQFISIPDYVKTIPIDSLRKNIGNMSDEVLRAHFSQLLSSFLFEVRMAFQTAAGKAFEQAAALMEDPDYEKTVKERRKRHNAKVKEYQEKSAAERKRLESGILTEEEIEREKKSCRRDIEYHERMLAMQRQRLLKLNSKEPVSNLDVEIDWPTDMFGEDGL